jgi:succinate dehydrogenase / fumarate reductase cytochrome b subunit
MSVTGLFLIAFLVVHCSANVLTLVPDGGLTFNAFASWLEHNLVIRTIEYVLFAAFIVHILQSITITIQNNKARPEKYAVAAMGATSTWSSRNMGILGTIIFIFLVIHMRDLFWDLRFHDEKLARDVNGNIDLNSQVVALFSLLPYTVIYVVAMFALGYHLWHGFPSSFRTLGLMHSKYTPAIVLIGKVYTIVITGIFIIIPIFWYIKQL